MLRRRRATGVLSCHGRACRRSERRKGLCPSLSGLPGTAVSPMRPCGQARSIAGCAATPVRCVVALADTGVSASHPCCHPARRSPTQARSSGRTGSQSSGATGTSAGADWTASGTAGSGAAGTGTARGGGVGAGPAAGWLRRTTGRTPAEGEDGEVTRRSVAGAGRAGGSAGRTTAATTGAGLGAGTGVRRSMAAAANTWDGMAAWTLDRAKRIAPVGNMATADSARAGARRSSRIASTAPDVIRRGGAAAASDNGGERHRVGR